MLAVSGPSFGPHLEKGGLMKSRLRKMLKRLHPSPAMVVALIAFFCSLTGVAAGVGLAKAVPLAKRALSADNAKKLQGKTAAQIVTSAVASAKPTSIASFVTVKTGAWAQSGTNVWKGYTVTCDPGQKAIGGGWDQTDPLVGGVASLSSAPTSDDSGWTVYIWDVGGTHSGSTYAICLK
jgi:hypothetical protein